jgi:prophage antirepressor-like protein
MKIDFEGVELQVLPDQDHEFFLETKDVANGFGITTNALRQQANRHPDEYLEDRHFIRAMDLVSVTKCNAHPQTRFWTKAGIVRLGMFIKSERAKLFRDWVEKLVLDVLDPSKDNKVERREYKTVKSMTDTRLISLADDIMQIPDDKLRMSIWRKLKFQTA